MIFQTRNWNFRIRNKLTLAYKFNFSIPSRSQKWRRQRSNINSSCLFKSCKSSNCMFHDGIVHVSLRYNVNRETTKWETSCKCLCKDVRWKESSLNLSASMIRKHNCMKDGAAALLLSIFRTCVNVQQSFYTHTCSSYDI